MHLNPRYSKLFKMISIFHPNFAQHPRAHCIPKAQPNAADSIALEVVIDVQGDMRSLDKTIETIVRQSFQAWKLWVRAPQAPENLAKDPRIEFLLSDQLLILSAPYVMSLNAGTLLEPTYFEKCVWHLESHPKMQAVRSRVVRYGARQGLELHQTLPLEQDSEGIVFRYTEASECSGKLEIFKFGIIEEHLLWVSRETSCKFSRSLSKSELPKLELPKARHYQFNSQEFSWSAPAKKERPRVLLILPWVTMGGSDKFNLDLVEQLSANGWDITISTTLRDPHNWLSEFSRYTDDIFAMSYFLNPGDHPRFLSHLMSTRQPDVVLTSHSEFGYLILPYLKALHPQALYLDYCHIETFDWMNGGYPNYAVRRQNVLDLNIVSSEHLKRWMAARGGAVGKIEVAYTNIDTARWKPDPEVRARIRSALTVPDEVPVLLYACRVVAQKQPQIFAGVVHTLANRGHRFLAVVAGDGELREWLEAYVQQHRLEKYVRFLDQLTNEQIQAVMSGSDIFFLPSEWEGISLAVFEAMSMELAIVGADVGGQRELVTPDCGVLIQRGTPEEELVRYVTALEPLLANPTAGRMMGKAARSRVQQNFELKQMGRRIVELFQRAAQVREIAPTRSVSVEQAISVAQMALRYVEVTEEINVKLAEYRQFTQSQPDSETLEQEELALAGKIEKETTEFNALLAKIKEVEDRHLLMRSALEQALGQIS